MLIPDMIVFKSKALVVMYFQNPEKRIHNTHIYSIVKTPINALTGSLNRQIKPFSDTIYVQLNKYITTTNSTKTHLFGVFTSTFFAIKCFIVCLDPQSLDSAHYMFTVLYTIRYTTTYIFNYHLNNTQCNATSTSVLMFLAILTQKTLTLSSQLDNNNEYAERNVN